MDRLISSDECNLIKIGSADQMSDHSSFIATLNETAKPCQLRKLITDLTENLTLINAKKYNQFRPNSKS